MSNYITIDQKFWYYCNILPSSLRYAATSRNDSPAILRQAISVARECVEFLFARYEQLVTPLAPAAKPDSNGAAETETTA